MQSPIGRKNTLFSSIPDTKDTKNVSDTRFQTQIEQNSGTNLRLEKLLASEEHPFKINAMTYYKNMDMLSVGLSNGQIVNYTLEIESFVYTGDSSISPSTDLVDHKRCK